MLPLFQLGSFISYSIYFVYMVYCLLLCFYINRTQYFGKPGPFFYPKVNPTVFQWSIRSMMLHHILNSTSQKFLQRVLKEQQCQWKKGWFTKQVLFLYLIKTIVPNYIEMLKPWTLPGEFRSKIRLSNWKNKNYIKPCEP